jgi:pyridoxal phosphate enzyme (YggS family)
VPHLDQAARRDGLELTLGRLRRLHGGRELTLDPDDVAARHAAIRARIDETARRAGRDPAAVEILAALKYVDAADLPALHAAGIRRVGENRSDALVEKQEAYGQLFTWDFIGHLQSRKVREVVGRVALVHSVESDSCAAQLQSRSEAPQDVLVEVNVADDPAKDGVLPEALDRFLEGLAALDRLRVLGLMTMPAFADDPQVSRPSFARLRELAAGCAERWAGTHSFDVLSMGTSQDYVVAVEEGATIVRLGSVLYSG